MRLKYVRIAIIAAVALALGHAPAALALSHTAPNRPALVEEGDMATPIHAHRAGSKGPAETQPWVEGVDPAFENELFRAAYVLLPSHNILKIYAIEANGYEAAGIRFSARVPHELRDLNADEIDHEAAALIRMTFTRFPAVQSVDVWGTIPVPVSKQRTIESTVFSVSADRDTFQQINDQGLDDAGFLRAFGHVWLAPQVPR